MSNILSKRRDFCSVPDYEVTSVDFISGASDVILALRNHLLKDELQIIDFEVAISALVFLTIVQDRTGFKKFFNRALDLAGEDGGRLYRVASQFHSFWLQQKHIGSPLEKDILVLEFTERFGAEYVSTLLTKMSSRNMKW